MTITVACLQMNSGPEVELNLEFVKHHAAIAAQAGVELLQLPENFAQMPRRATDQVVEQENEGEIQDFLRQLAAEYGLHIIAGSIPVSTPDGAGKNPYARCLMIGSQGQVLASYDKIHLFDVELPSGEAYKESDRYRPGPTERSNHVVISLPTSPSIQLGLSICYDLRFPEFYRELINAGAQILSVPSAFTYDTGEAHWELLLRTRAIENQAFVFAAAQTGEHANGRLTWGHSMIIDPWGRVLVKSDDQLGLITAVIDPIDVQSLRQKFPTLKNRRL